MVEAAEEEARQTEPGLVGWGRWSPAVEWSVLIDFQPREGPSRSILRDRVDHRLKLYCLVPSPVCS